MNINGNEPARQRNVDSEEVEVYERIQRIQFREARERGERKLRMGYALAFLALMALHLVAIWAVIFLLGFGLIELDRWVTTTFISGSLGQIVGIIWVVTRYLFPAEPGAAGSAAG